MWYHECVLFHFPLPYLQLIVSDVVTMAVVLEKHVSVTLATLEPYALMVSK